MTSEEISVTAVHVRCKHHLNFVSCYGKWQENNGTLCSG